MRTNTIGLVVAIGTSSTLGAVVWPSRYNADSIVQVDTKMWVLESVMTSN